MAVLNLIRKEMLQMRWILIIGIIFGLALAVIIVATFHYIEQIMTDIPAELLEALSRYEATRELLFIFGDYSLYVWSQWNAKNLLQAGALFAIIIAAFQFAGEISRRTIAFYLTRPLTRRQGYLAKIAAGFLIILTIFVIGTLFIYIASTLAGHSADWARLTAALFASLIWLTAYYLLAAIISSMNREPINAGVIAGLSGIALSLPGLFVLGRQFSLFYQARAADYFIYGQPLLIPIGAGLVLNAALFLVGLRVFESRDF